MDAINFEAVKVALRQNDKGFMLTLSIHPDDIPDAMIRDFVGARYAVAMVRIGEDEQPYVNPKPNKFVQTAGILARDPMFQKFCAETGLCSNVSEDDAIKSIHDHCEIATRAELISNTAAKVALVDLRTEFEEWKRA